MKIYYNEKTGESITLEEMLSERNEKLIEAIRPKYEEIYADYEFNVHRKKPLGIKFGGRITQVILTELSRLQPMSRADWASLDCDDLSAWYTSYMDFICNYSIFDIPSTRQLLCAYMGIAVGKFVDLMNDDTDIDRKEKAIMINDDITSLLFSQAESSNNNSSAVLTRGKIKDAGQGMKVAQNELNFNVLNVTSPEVNMAKALEIANNYTKQLGIKK